MYWLSMKNLRIGSVITIPITATAFSLRLRLHYKAARVGGVRHSGSETEYHSKRKVPSRFLH
jgi:hypothetical protein